VWFFAFGVILLFSGLPMMAVSNLSQNKTYTTIIEYAGDDKPASWNVSAYFEKGDSIVVDYRPDVNWTEPPFEFSDEFPDVPLKLVDFNIIDPKGDNTLFIVYMAQVSDQPLLAQLKIEVMKNYSSDGLNVNDYPEKIEGIAKYDGVYKVVTTGPWPAAANVTPPWWLSLSKKYSETVYSLAFLLPVGAFCTVLGIALTAWGIKSPKRRVIRQKAKTSRLKL